MENILIGIIVITCVAICAWVWLHDRKQKDHQDENDDIKWSTDKIVELAGELNKIGVKSESLLEDIGELQKIDYKTINAIKEEKYEKFYLENVAPLLPDILTALSKEFTHGQKHVRFPLENFSLNEEPLDMIYWVEERLENDLGDVYVRKSAKPPFSQSKDYFTISLIEK